MGDDAEPSWTPEQRAAIIAELRRKFPDRELYPVQRGNLASQWELMADLARLQDAGNQDPQETWVPPTLAALVAAVRRTRLSRFYPFTGHEYLYFADGPGVWHEKGRDCTRVHRAEPARGILRSPRGCLPGDAGPGDLHAHDARPRRGGGRGRAASRGMGMERPEELTSPTAPGLAPAAEASPPGGTSRSVVNQANVA
jgi:hypothetical protein